LQDFLAAVATEEVLGFDQAAAELAGKIAGDLEVVRVVDDMRVETTLMTTRPPSLHEAPQGLKRGTQRVSPTAGPKLRTNCVPVPVPADGRVCPRRPCPRRLPVPSVVSVWGSAARLFLALPITDR
jgi:hypothetical protein